jgi:predicted phosphohydrolase
MPKKYVWLSDTHLSMSILPIMKRRFIDRITSINADGLILTGDISNGLWLESDLRYLAEHHPNPIYFVLGNHDYYWRHMGSVHEDVRRLCKEYPNLVWLSEHDAQPIAPGVSLLGHEGWFDANCGDRDSTWWAIDRVFNFDFWRVGDHVDQIYMWRQMAKLSAESIEKRLKEAVAKSDVVYVATHFPPWPEASRADGKILEKLWHAYNTNITLGKSIEKIASTTKSQIVVLAGHTHLSCNLTVAKNLSCKVISSSYWGKVGPEELIVL